MYFKLQGGVYRYLVAQLQVLVALYASLRLEFPEADADHGTELGYGGGATIGAC